VPETVGATGDRLRSPRRERIYGLTERAARFAADRAARHRDPRGRRHAARDRVARSARRDRRDEDPADVLRLRAVLPELARLRPRVDGTTFGLFDLAKSDPRTIAFRFETGTTPASRRLVLPHLRRDPEYATILDEYTNVTGRPFVPPDWVFLTGGGAASSTSGATAPLDGVDVNADARRRREHVRRARDPAGRLPLRPARVVGEYGFARWAWDADAAPEIDATLASLRRAATGS
jgi:hypothetical protein